MFVLDALIKFLLLPGVTIWLIVRLVEPEITLPIAWKPSRLKVYGVWYIAVALLGSISTSISQAAEVERMKNPAYAAAKQAEEEQRALKRREEAEAEKLRREQRADAEEAERTRVAAELEKADAPKLELTAFNWSEQHG